MDSIERFYSGENLLGMGQIGYLVGAYCGIVVQHSCFEGMSHIEKPKQKTRLKGCLRFLTMISFIVIYNLLLIVVPKAENIYIRLCF